MFLFHNSNCSLNLHVDICPWLSPTNGNHLIKCADGDFCDVSLDHDGWGCCANHGGKSKCSKRFPIMCASENCADYGNDYCCGTMSQCMQNHGGVRKCEENSKI